MSSQAIIRSALVFAAFALPFAVADTEFFAVPNVVNETWSLPPLISSPTAAEDIISAIVCIIFGLLLVLAGYRFYKFTLFCAAFFLAYVITFSLLSGVHVTNLIALYVSPAAVGLVCGFLVVWFAWVGLFAAGAIAGFTLASWILTWASVPLITSLVAHWAFIITISIFFGIVALLAKKPILILATAWFGSFFTFYGIDVFARLGYADAFKSILTGDERVPFDTKLYYMLAASLVLFLIGVAAQFGCTARGIDHHASKNGGNQAKNVDAQNTTIVQVVPMEFIQPARK